MIIYNDYLEWSIKIHYGYTSQTQRLFGGCTVQRRRSHDITQVQKNESGSAATEGKPAVKPSDSEDFGSGLTPIDVTRFKAQRPRQDPFSHGFWAQKHNKRLTLRIPANSYDSDSDLYA